MSSRDVEIHLKAYDEASSTIQGVGNSLSVTMQDIEGNTQSLVDTTQNASSQITESYQQMGGAAAELESQQAATSMSMQDTSLAMTSVAFAGASMAMTVNNLENAYVRLDRANLMVEKSTLAVETAQDAYNTAVAKYGENSQQAQDAAAKLQVAQDALSVSLERQDMSQRMLNMDYVFAAISVIPAVIGVVNLMKGALEAADISIELTSESLIALATNPIFLVIAGIVAVGVVIYELIQSQNAAAEAQAKWTAEINAAQTSISSANDALNMYATTTDQFTDKTSALTNAESDLESKLGDLNKQLASDVDAYNEVMRAQENSKTAAAAAASDEAKAANAKIILDRMVIDEINAKIKVLQDESDYTKLTTETSKAYFDLFTSQTPQYQSAVAKMGDALDAYMHQDMAATAQKQVDATTWASISGDESKITDQYYKGMDDMITGFANSQGVHFSDMLKSLTTYISDKEKAQATELADQQKTQDALDALNAKHVATLQTDYFDKVVKQTEVYTKSLEDSATQYNDFLGESLDSTNMVVQAFADKWGISWDDAEKALSTFAQATNSTIETDLLGTAQASFAEFQKCMTGKSLTLTTDVSGNMKSLTDNITGLIQNGLVGEAQTEMQAYVNCNTDKVATMVDTISTDMTTLTTNYNTQLTQMKAIAETLTGQEKDAVLSEIDSLTTQYEDKMAQLKDWQAQLLGQMTQNVDTQFADMTATAIQYAVVMKGQLVSQSIWPDMLDEMYKQTDEGLSNVEKRFAKMSDTVQGNMPTGQGVGSLGGGGGRVPANTISQPIIVSVTGPLVNVEGSADERTAKLAADKAMNALKTVIVEATSSGATSTQKRIRKGATF